MGLVALFFIPIFALIFYVGIHLLVKVLAPKDPPGQYQGLVYECGLIPKEQKRFFSVRFFVVALIFLVFDVETTLMIPLMKIFKPLNEKGEGLFLLLLILSFMIILVEGLLFCWKKGDLQWLKD